MREKYRNPIASIKKFPQFTIMNVIDGQAGLIICASLIFYSLTTDNILNIIVLLILAGISIQMLTGDNGILQKAAEAKERNDESQIIEEVKMDILAKIAENNGKAITETQIKDVLKKYFNSSEVDELNIQENLAESTDEITTLDGKYKIRVSDIYSGNIQPMEAGLYDQETGVLKMSWDDLVQNRLIAETNGIVSYGTNNDRYNLEGKLVFPSNITEIAAGTFGGHMKITEIVLPNGLNKINDRSFSGVQWNNRNS